MPGEFKMDFIDLYRKHTLNIGKRYHVNGGGDLGMDRGAREFIGKDVTVLRQLKSGLYEVTLPDGQKSKFAKNNLSPLPDENYVYNT